MTPLEVREVVKTFGTRRALDGASLVLNDHEILGLLGPNGAGKSTLVRTIMGRVTPETGSVVIFGREATAGDQDIRQDVGVVPQEIALYPLLTARENLRVFGSYLGLKGAGLQEAIDRALGWSGLTDRANEAAKTFSGGMKRRLNIAAGVLHQPRILLLDEPTVGVDPQSRERIFQMIESLREQGLSVIYTTHYMEEAERLCDRIAIIDHGRVIAAGTKQQLVEQTIGTRREITLHAADVPEPAIQEIRSRGGEMQDGRFVVRAENPATEIAALMLIAERHRLTISDISMRAPTLENVFLHLTGRELRE